MNTVTLAALSTGVFALAVAQLFNLKLIKSLMERVKALEHFVYPEWQTTSPSITPNQTSEKA